MHVILWRFRPRAGAAAPFEAAYAPQGPWGELFRRDPDFLGTELLRASDGTYLTLDRWTSAAAYAAFRARHASDYDALDDRCAALVADERPLGAVEI